MVQKKNTRDPLKERYWRKVVQNFKDSGLATKQFCQREGLSESQFYSWRREIGKRDQEEPIAKSKARRSKKVVREHQPSPAVPEFIPVKLVTVTSEPQPAPLEITSPAGFVIRIAAGVDARLLHLVLSVLKDLAC